MHKYLRAHMTPYQIVSKKLPNLFPHDEPMLLYWEWQNGEEYEKSITLWSSNAWQIPGDHLTCSYEDF